MPVGLNTLVERWLKRPYRKKIKEWQGAREAYIAATGRLGAAVQRLSVAAEAVRQAKSAFAGAQNDTTSRAVDAAIDIADNEVVAVDAAEAASAAAKRNDEAALAALRAAAQESVEAAKKGGRRKSRRSKYSARKSRRRSRSRK